MEDSRLKSNISNTEGLDNCDFPVTFGLVLKALEIRIETKNEQKHAEIDITLTSPGCPAAAEIMAATHRAALSTEGLDSVHVNLVWTPRWDPKVHASEDAKMDMGIWD